MDINESNTTYLSRESWKKMFDGWHIVGYAVRTANVCQVIARKTIAVEEQSGTWNHDIPARLITLNLEQTEETRKFGWAEAIGFNRPHCGVSRKPLAQGLMVARNSKGSVQTVSGYMPPSIERIGKGLNPAP